MGIQCEYESLLIPRFPVTNTGGSTISFLFDSRSARSQESKTRNLPAQATENREVKFEMADDYILSSASFKRSSFTEMGPTLLYQERLSVYASQHIEIELLHHYYSGAPWPLTPVSERQAFWRSIFPSNAQSSDYVLYALQCFSALHLASVHTENCRRYQVISIRCHLKAIATFRTQVCNINEANRDAVLCFIGLLVVIELGFMNPSYDNYHADKGP